MGHDAGSKQSGDSGSPTLCMDVISEPTCPKRVAEGFITAGRLTAKRVAPGIERMVTDGLDRASAMAESEWRRPGASRLGCHSGDRRASPLCLDTRLKHPGLAGPTGLALPLGQIPDSLTR